MSSSRGKNGNVLVAGGGTGGHVFPALAMAEVLAERGWRVSWCGRPDSLEASLVSGHGLDFHALQARPLVGKGIWGKVRALFALAFSTLRAFRLLGALDSEVVVGTGGYVSASPILAARLGRRPALLLEPNAEAGVANRFLSRWATKAAVAYPETARQLKCPVVHTGVPVRSEFFALGDPPTAQVAVLVLGGSQGAEQLNALVPRALSLLDGKCPSLRILHQAGRAHLESTRERYAAAGLRQIDFEIVPFLDDVATAMAASSLVISRAGAITLAEICAAGRAAALLPLALAGGHQKENARRLEAVGGAVLLPAADEEGNEWARVLEALLNDRPLLSRMGAKSRSLARPDAAERIAQVVIELKEAA